MVQWFSHATVRKFYFLPQKSWKIDVQINLFMTLAGSQKSHNIEKKTQKFHNSFVK